MIDDLFLVEPLLAFLDVAGVPLAGAAAVLEPDPPASADFSTSCISVSSVPAGVSSILSEDVFAGCSVSPFSLVSRRENRTSAIAMLGEWRALHLPWRLPGLGFHHHGPAAVPQ